MIRKPLVALFILAGLTGPALAAQPTLDEAISQLGHSWAAASYKTPEKQQEAAFEKAITAAQAVAKQYPDKAEPKIWEAILLSSEAKVQGGLSALSKVRLARDLLLDAEKVNPDALNGSIYNSLGSLYAKVPGWPIGFGDKKKATEYFEKALAINPNGIDPNYFYADLLADQGQYAKAVEHLQRALAAPPRPGRADADTGRRQDVARLLADIKQKHGDQLASQ